MIYHNTHISEALYMADNDLLVKCTKLNKTIIVARQDITKIEFPGGILIYLIWKTVKQTIN